MALFSTTARPACGGDLLEGRKCSKEFKLSKNASKSLNKQDQEKKWVQVKKMTTSSCSARLNFFTNNKSKFLLKEFNIVIK
ncbi:hypothetical protein BpHYR1_009519 [Brachionus plicatilis]|uniref:Uncharacterized protein n=1 Tax=Brachionus plicatilis TaxID=10195 RepID=A0A3M7STM5_BRAPC|nr:hypothetical protein BpHYR1_009519 [Brachionus plicatilis]